MSGKGERYKAMKSVKSISTLALVVILIVGSIPIASASDLGTIHDEALSQGGRTIPSQDINQLQITPNMQSSQPPRQPEDYPLLDLSFQPIFINMKAATFDPLISEPEFPPNLSYDKPGDYYLLQCKDSIQSQWVLQLQNLNAVIFGYIPDFTYLLYMNFETAEKVFQLPFVRWIGVYHPAYKLPEDLLEKKGDIDLDVVIFPNKKDNLNSVSEKLEDMKGTIINGIDNNIIRVKIDAQKIRDIAFIPEVEWIDEYTEPVALMNHVRAFTGAETVYIDGFDGTGIVGEVKDNGIDETHPDFVGQLIGTDGNPSDGDHGTACFGIVFSSGANEADATGMMPGGEGVFCDWGVGRKQSINNLVNNWGGVFQSNSWHITGQTDGTYNSNSRRNDEAVFENDVSMLYAAGNSNNGVYPSSISTDAAAKNIITVGAVYHYNDEIKSNDQWVNWGPGATPSQGPASDGRIKPDLAGVFDMIYTTDSVDGDGEDGYASGNYYSNFGGTSGATPIVAGAAGIAYQMYKEDFFGNNPSGSLPAASTIKALLIADAHQYEFFQANRFQQGWGLVDLENTYEIGKNHFIVDQDVNLQTGQYINYTVAPTFDGPIKISLVWTDVPGTTSSSQHLINDLNLQVTDPDGFEYLGNYGLDNSKWSQIGGSADSINNVENVFIENPNPGKWTISVYAQNIALDGNVGTPQIDQHFSIVASNVLQSLHDLGVAELTVPTYVAPGSLTSISASVYNNGLSQESDILVNFTIDGTLKDSQVISSIDSGNSTSVVFDWSFGTGIFMVGIEVEILPDENLTLNNFKEKWVISEPDTAVISLTAPRFSLPSQSVMVNATISNLGKVDLTNIQVQLLLNGTIEDSKIISNLPKESLQNITFTWTPTLEGWYLIEVYALPHIDESLVLDNRLNSSILITSEDPLNVVIVDSWGTDFADEAPWDYINSNWIEFGSSPVLIDYTSLNKEDITYNDIVSTNADVLFISGAYTHEFTDSEIEAISDYVLGGSGLVATSVTFFQNVPNNNKLAFLFGMRDDLSYDADFTPTLNLTDPAHPLFVDVPNPYSTGSQITSLPSDFSWDASDIIDGTYVAKSEDDMGAIITHKGVVYISSWIEYQSNTDDMQLLYNAMTWSQWQRDLHDISVSDLQVPRYVGPGDTVFVNATVFNVGISDEVDITVSLLVDGVVDSQTTIPSLASDSFVPVNFLWTAPNLEKVYTLKIEASSLPLENITENNFVEGTVIVSGGSALGSIGLISDASQLDAITSILDDMTKSYDNYYDNSQNDHTSDIMLMLQYETVIFYNHNRQIDTFEQQALIDYIELGGKLVVTGFDSLGAPDDVLMAEVVRSTSVGDNMGEGSFSVTDDLHPIMDGIFGKFTLGSTYPVSQTDHDNAEADLSKNAKTIAQLNDGYDKIIVTELARGGKVVYWNGNRNCDDWIAVDTTDMFKNMIVWLMPIYNEIGIISYDIPQTAFVDDTISFSATVINLGLNNTGNFDVVIIIRDFFGQLLSFQSKTINSLSHLQTSNITWQWSTPYSGDYYAEISLSVSNDEIPGNNIVSEQITVYYKFLEDDMESGTNGWDASASTLSPLWHLTTIESYSPTTSWWCGMDSASQYSVLGEQYLTSPEIDLIDATSAYFSFYHMFSLDDYPIGGDWGNVEINPGGSGWSSLDSYDTMQLDWSLVTLDLTAYVGDTISLRFHLAAGVVLTDNGWWVDDVLVYGFKNQYGIELSPAISSASAGKNEFAFFEIDVKNTGNVITDFTLNLTGSEVQNWLFSFNPDTFSLLPGWNIPVNITIFPSQTEAGDYSFSVVGQAESQGVAKAQDTLDLFLTVEPWYEVDLSISSNFLNLIPGKTNHFDISVLNIGNTYDSISFDLEFYEAGVSSSWNFQISKTSLNLDAFDSENITLTIFAPIDGVMGDYLLVNLTATSSGDANENAKVFTTSQIAEFYLMELSATSIVKETNPKDPVNYYLEVKNLGNTQITVDMTVSPLGNWEGWTALLEDLNFVVGAYSSKNVTLTVTPADNLLENEFKEFEINSQSAFNSSSIIVKTIIQRTGDIEIFVDENEQNAKIGEFVFYQFTVSNTQNANDTIEVRASSRFGWMITLYKWDGVTELEDSDSDGKSDTGYLEPFNDNADIIMGVEIPNDAEVLMEDKITVTFSSSLSNGSVKSIDVTAITDPSGVVTIESESYSESAPSGSQINYLIRVNNLFNYDTALDIVVTEVYNWEMEIYEGDGTSLLKDSNNNGILDTGKLDAFGGISDIMIVLSVPENALAYTKNIITVEASSSEYNGGEKSIALNATVNRIYDFEIEMTTETALLATAGGEVEFTIRISNSGNYEETLDMRFGELPFGWKGYYSNNEPSVPIGSSKTVTVTIEVPKDAGSGDYLVFIRGITDDEVEFRDLSVSVEVEEKEEGPPVSLILILLLIVVIIVLVLVVTVRRKSKKADGKMQYPSQYLAQTASQDAPRVQAKYMPSQVVQAEVSSRYPSQTSYPQGGYGQPVFPSFETIKCPMCYAAFEVETGIRPARVRCPKCGTTGTIR
jgi:uncharacterized membrane protein